MGVAIGWIGGSGVRDAGREVCAARTWGGASLEGLARITCGTKPYCYTVRRPTRLSEKTAGPDEAGIHTNAIHKQILFNNKLLLPNMHVL